METCSLYEFLTLTGCVEGEICWHPAKITVKTTDSQAVSGYQVWIYLMGEDSRPSRNPTPEQLFSKDVVTFHLDHCGRFMDTKSNEDCPEVREWFVSQFPKFSLPSLFPRFLAEMDLMVRLVNTQTFGPLNTSTSAATILAWLNLLIHKTNSIPKL